MSRASPIPRFDSMVKNVENIVVSANIYEQQCRKLNKPAAPEILTLRDNLASALRVYQGEGNDGAA